MPSRSRSPHAVACSGAAQNARTRANSNAVELACSVCRKHPPQAFGSEGNGLVAIGARQLSPTAGPTARYRASELDHCTDALVLVLLGPLCVNLCEWRYVISAPRVGDRACEVDNEP